MRGDAVRDSTNRGTELSKRHLNVSPAVIVPGGLTGHEDLIVEGRVETAGSLQVHNITIGSSGRVRGDIYGTNICVEGEVDGNLYGSERVVIRGTGKVLGNVQAPKVRLEHGARLDGGVDMELSEAPGALTTRLSSR